MNSGCLHRPRTGFFVVHGAQNPGGVIHTVFQDHEVKIYCFVFYILKQTNVELLPMFSLIIADKRTVP